MNPYYEHAGITIYHGRSEEIVPSLEQSFDLLLTDPPYGIGEGNAKRIASRGCSFGGKNSGRRNQVSYSGDYGDSSWDKTPVDASLMDAVRSLAKNQIIFGGNYYALPPTSCWLVWDKCNGTNDFADAELAWTNLPKAVRLIRYMWNGMLKEQPEERFHPTQKPLAIMKWCLSHAPSDIKSVVDPFMGSGTSLIAAKSFGLSCSGIDAEERYCEIAAKRLAQEVLF